MEKTQNEKKEIQEMALVCPQKIVSFDGLKKGQHLYIEQRQEIAQAYYNEGYRKLATSQKETTEEVDDVGDRRIDPERWDRLQLLEKLKCSALFDEAVANECKLTATKIIATICEYLGKNQKFVAVNDERSVWVDCEKLFAFIEKTATEYGVEV